MPVKVFFGGWGGGGGGGGGGFRGVIVLMDNCLMRSCPITSVLMVYWCPFQVMSVRLTVKS